MTVGGSSRFLNSTLHTFRSQIGSLLSSSRYSESISSDIEDLSIQVGHPRVGMNEVLVGSLVEVSGSHFIGGMLSKLLFYWK